MTDRYSTLVQSSIGKKVAKNLGLPLPLTLDRFESGQKLVRGSVLFGAASGDDKRISQSVARILAELHAEVYVNDEDASTPVFAEASVDVKSANGHQDNYKVLIFDASNITNATELEQLYAFFHPVARQMAASGRVIVIGRPPEECDGVQYAMVQRALEGFVRSVGKEFKKGITAQLVYVQAGEENNLDSTLRFFTSARSAYVSGQVVRVGAGESAEVDWKQPLAGTTMLRKPKPRGLLYPLKINGRT